MDKNEHFEIIKPVQSELKGKIAYYYFHHITDPSYSRSFYYYPNYRIALNIFKGSKVSWDDNTRNTSPSKNEQITSILTFTHQQRRQVIMKGQIKKIGIVFEPLGLNHFVQGEITDYLQETISDFNLYGNHLHTLGNNVFAANNIEDRRELLDHFFMDKYKPFSKKDIQRAVDLIMEREGAIQVAELARQLFMSRKTLYRLFVKHLSIHPKAFINLVKFRTALNLFKKRGSEISLSSLAHLCKYYDQASFIKHIQSSTGTNPRKFFFELDDLANSETVWKTDRN